MGQRHQIYVVTMNPKPNPDGTRDEKDFVKRFGKGESVVFPYHHQWLYGKTALLNCLGLLKSKNKIDFSHLRRYFYTFEENLSLIFKAVMTLTPRNSGKTVGEIVNYEGKEYPQMITRFDLGDNNDGITIVCPELGKYCFMYINEPYEEGAINKPYNPLTAEQYLLDYYPDEEKRKEYGCLDLPKKFDKYELFTVDELKEIFPKWK